MSYASADARLVHSVVACLRHKAPQLRVFCYGLSDSLPEDTDLVAGLASIYGRKSRHCVLFVSDHYSTEWTSHELRQMFGRYRSGDTNALKLVRLGDLDLPELPSTHHWVDLRLTTVPVLVQRLRELLEVEPAAAPDGDAPQPFDPLWETQRLLIGLADGVDEWLAGLASLGFSCRRYVAPREENEPEVVAIAREGEPVAFISLEIEPRASHPALVIRSGVDYENWPRDVVAFAEVEFSRDHGMPVARVYDIDLGCTPEAMVVLSYPALLEAVALKAVRAAVAFRPASGSPPPGPGTAPGRR